MESIVKRYLSAYPEIANTVIDSVKENIAIIDWWQKDSVISRIIRDIARILQVKMSAQKSKTLANTIAKELIL